MSQRAEIVAEILAERARQHAMFGEQHFQFGARTSALAAALDAAERYARREQKAGSATWAAVLTEEVCEALRAPTPDKQREELVQVAALAIQIIESLERA